MCIILELIYFSSMQHLQEMLPFFHKDDKETITKLTPMVSIMQSLDALDRYVAEL